jgi:hypothetical protein
MTSFAGAAAAQLAGDAVDAVVLFRLAMDTPVRLWSGFGDMEIPADLVETSGPAIYNGTGALANLPLVGQLINGAAERLTFTLSGVDAQASALADAEAASVRFRAVRLGIMILGADLQPLSGVAWLWSGTADTPVIERENGPGGAVRTISLSVGSVFTGRRRPPLGYYTDPDQKRRSPTDRFCERVSLYAEDTVRQWPAY